MQSVKREPKMNAAESLQTNVSEQSNGAVVSRILVRGVNWLGDAVMTTPALRRLRELHPGARVTLLMPEKIADLFVGHPDVDEVLTFAIGEGPWRVGRRLRSKRFDLAVVFPNSPRSALEVWFTGARRRVGYARSWRSLFLTDAISARVDERPMRKRGADEIRRLISGPAGRPVSFPAQAHHIHQYLHLIRAIGGSAEACEPRLHVTDAERAAGAARLGNRTSIWIGLNAGAEYGPAKRWPIDRFISVAKRLAKEPGCGLILFGGKSDAPLTSEIEQAVHSALPLATVVDVAGRTSLRDLCSLMSLCRVVLTNDTGPMHVAAAVGATVVVPFGSTSPELTGPGLPGAGRHAFLRGSAPCSPCFLRECPIDFRCMTATSEDAVMGAVLGAIGRS